MFFLSEAFDNYDPLGECSASYHYGELDNIVKRSHDILSKRNRSKDDIQIALNRLDWILCELGVRASLEDYINQYDSNPLDMVDEDDSYEPPGQPEPPLIEDDDRHWLMRRNYSNVAILFLYKDHFNLDDIDDFKDGTWAEYFAVLALANVGIYTQNEKKYLQLEVAEDIRTDLVLSHSREITDAMESVCYAEQLEHELTLLAMIDDKSKLKAKEIASRQATKAAIAKHADNNRLKADFFGYYKSGDFPSMREAARRFYNSLPEDRQIYTSTAHGVRVLTTALSQHRKK